MAKINLNTLAKEVALKEGLKESVSIAQIKEVMRWTLWELSNEWRDGNEEGVIALFKSKAANYPLKSEH